MEGDPDEGYVLPKYSCRKKQGALVQLGPKTLLYMQHRYGGVN